jgi:hypothetical protein
MYLRLLFYALIFNWIIILIKKIFEGDDERNLIQADMIF